MIELLPEYLTENALFLPKFSKACLHCALKNRASSMLEHQNVSLDGHFSGSSMLRCNTNRKEYFFYTFNLFRTCISCSIWVFTLKETFRHKTHFTVLLHFEVRSHYNKIENQEGGKSWMWGLCLEFFFLSTFSFVSVLILFYFCNCLLSWNEYMNTNEVSLTWYATFYVFFLTYLTLKVLRIRKVGSCRCHQNSSFLPKNFLN